MVIDSSAIIAILRNESERDDFVGRIHREGVRLLSAPTLVEASMVAEGRAGSAGLADLDDLLEQFAVVTVAFDEEQASIARRAWQRYGKGRHPAGLNLGDCFAYTLARHRDEPLLFKGDDFSKTDVRKVVLPA